MTHPDPKCPVCKISMDEGFIVDKTHHSTAVQAEWVKGKPEKTRWSGINVKDREMHAIVTFRCSKCGWLVNFAP
jgi:phage FluMu protein Com